MSTTELKLDAFTIRRISIAGDGVDPRTVHAYLSGLALRTTTRLRVERALREVGFSHLVRPASIVPAIPQRAFVASAAKAR